MSGRPPTPTRAVENLYRHEVNVGGHCFEVAASVVYPDLNGDRLPWLYVETFDPLPAEIAARAVRVEAWARFDGRRRRVADVVAWLIPRRSAAEPELGPVDWIVPGDAPWSRGHTPGDRYVRQASVRVAGQTEGPFEFETGPFTGRHVMGALSWGGLLRPVYADKSGRIEAHFGRRESREDFCHADGPGGLPALSLDEWHAYCRAGLAYTVRRESGWLVRRRAANDEVVPVVGRRVGPPGFEFDAEADEAADVAPLDADEAQEDAQAVLFEFDLAEGPGVPRP